MATIALYHDKINQMPGLIKDIKMSVTDYKTELSALRARSLNINKSICNLDDVISSVRTSTQTQEQKIAFLDTFSRNHETFVADVIQVDSDVADVIRQRKEAFYNKYNYLKPECEKDWLEKAGDWLDSACEWCKKNWVVIRTILVVIAIAVLAVVTFGVAVAAIAAIAGIISLVLCAADVICMLATGGKDLATVFREKGWNVLADIFTGISVGCDIVSIVLPAAAAIKSMAKVGVKTFAKASFKAIKTAFKESIEKVFKSGLKNGFKNAGKLLFKTFIFDIDDFTKMKNGKRVWNLMAEPLNMIGPSKNWIVDGDQLIPSSTAVPGNANPDGLTMSEIMRQEKFSQFPNEIPYKNGQLDLSGFSVAQVDISMKNLDFDIEGVLSGDINNTKFSRILRDINYKNAEAALPEGITLKSLEDQFGFQITLHEDLAMKKVYFVPYEIHGNVHHTGAISNFKNIFKGIPDIGRLVGKKSTQFGFRFGLDNLIGATAGK